MQIKEKKPRYCHRRGDRAAISRADLTDEILYKDRLCGGHCVSGQAAKAWDSYNVDWVPTLNLGHDKERDKTNLKQASQRGQKASEKERKRKEQPRARAMKLNKIDRPHTTPTVRAICKFAVYFSVFRPFLSLHSRL